MKKFILLLITVISGLLLTSCLNFSLGTKTETPTVNTPTPVNVYSVTFMNGDTIHKTYNVSEGDKVSKPTNPTKEGYTFICWSTSNTVKNEFDFNSSITGNLTLYAYYEVNEPTTEPTVPSTPTEGTPLVETFTVTFISDNNTFLTVEIEKGNKVTKPSDPTKEGYTFICWSTNNAVKNEYDFNLSIRDELTLYAYYEVNEQTQEPTEDIPTQDGNEPTVEPTIPDTPTQSTPEIETFSVTFIVDSSVYDSSVVNNGDKVTKPTDPSKVNYVFVCWSTSNATKDEYNFNTTITTDLTLYAWFIEEQPVITEPINVTQFSGYNEGAYLEFDSEGYNTTDFSVTYVKEGSNNAVSVDKELIRKNGSTVRVDILGLQKGNYNVTIVNNQNNKTVTKAIYASNHDRSGYAHFDNNGGVGAYNDNGALKTNAVVIYVTDATKNTVTAKFGNKTYTGLGAILSAAKNSSYPLCIRVIGSIKTAQWNYKSHGKGSSSDRTASLNNTFSGVTFSSSKLSYDAIVSAGINSMSNDLNNGITILNGLTTQVSYSSGEYDSYYNMLDISAASNITVEGVGTDAMIYQWGFNFKQCNNIEVRNLTFDSYTEDALGFEGNKNDISQYGNYWIHNCTFNIGVNNWDVSYEADKYDGDGSTDFKYCRGVTVSYTTYNNTHKTMLIGGNDEAKQYNFTLHHNYFNNCSSRLPLVRQANIHMYNNYFYKTTSVCSSIRANCSAFIENNYYEDSKNPIMVVVKSSYTGTSVKAYGNEFVNCSTSGNSSSDTYYKTNTVSDRTALISGSCNPTGSKELINFDTNSSLFYYDSVNKVSKVENLLNASAVKEHCLKLSGVLKGDFISDVAPEQPTPDTPTIPDEPTQDGDDNNPSDPNLETTYITFNNIPDGDITNPSSFGNFKINPLSGKTCATGNCDLVLANLQINKCLRLGGGGSYTSLNVNFNISSKANITVYFASSGSSTRYAALFDSSNNKTQAATGSSSQTDVVSYTFSNVVSGNYSIGSSSSGLNIYLIVIEYI